MKKSEAIEKLQWYLDKCAEHSATPYAADIIRMIEDLGMTPPPLPFKSPNWEVSIRCWEPEED